MPRVITNVSSKQQKPKKKKHKHNNGWPGRQQRLDIINVQVIILLLLRGSEAARRGMAHWLGGFVEPILATKPDIVIVVVVIAVIHVRRLERK